MTSVLYRVLLTWEHVSTVLSGRVGASKISTLLPIDELAGCLTVPALARLRFGCFSERGLERSQGVAGVQSRVGIKRSTVPIWQSFKQQVDDSVGCHAGQCT